MKITWYSNSGYDTVVIEHGEQRQVLDATSEVIKATLTDLGNVTDWVGTPDDQDWAPDLEIDTLVMSRDICTGEVLDMDATKLAERITSHFRV